MIEYSTVLFVFIYEMFCTIIRKLVSCDLFRPKMPLFPNLPVSIFNYILFYITIFCTIERGFFYSGPFISKYSNYHNLDN